MADTGGSGGKTAGSPVKDARTILRAVDWLQAHEEDIPSQLWQETATIATTCKSPRTRLRAISMLADRFDPIPKAPMLEVHAGDISLTWQTSSFPTPLVDSKRSSTPPSTSNGHAPRLSSATDVLESL